MSPPLAHASEHPAGRDPARATPATLLVGLLQAGQAVRFVARGASMWPAIRDGAVVDVTPCPPFALRPGDIGAYASSKGTIVVHRVAAVSPTSLRFAGDSLGGPDEAVDARQVLGRVTIVVQPRLHLRWPSAWHLRLLLRRSCEWLRPAAPRKP